MWRFLELIKREFVRKYEQYQVPPPLKDKKEVLPNNRKSAMKRIQSLKKKFERNEQLCNQYKCFMDELIDKGYARICDSEEPEGKTWQLPR